MSGSDNSMKHKHTVTTAVAMTAFLFGLLVWVYVVLIRVTHSEWLSGPFSHVDIFPFNGRLDEVGMAAFAIAALGFFVWQIELNMKSD
ncbi:MAG: hypothetical protein ABSE39_11485 [Candidatus Bathyarchaeia archaeon]|jgi:hypothetical protein